MYAPSTLLQLLEGFCRKQQRTDEHLNTYLDLAACQLPINSGLLRARSLAMIPRL